MIDPELPPVVVLSTADFHSDVWTNKQHLASRLAVDTRVTYVESFGLRRPRVLPSDLARVVRRIGRAGTPSRQAPGPENLEVISPVVVPFHDRAPARWLNRRIVDRLQVPDLDNSVLWTFSPVTYGLADRARSVVYHAVDLLHTQPRASARAILDGERHLVRTADVVIASSEGVRAHLRSMGRKDVLLWENVADTDVFAVTSTHRQPRAVFAGNLTSTKVSSRLLLGVADAGIDVVVAGPRAIDGADGRRTFDDVLAHPRIEYVGVLKPSSLADLFASSMVGLIPYELNDYTAGVFPLKVYEYLAAGLAVVSTRLPSLAGLDDPGVACHGDEQFVTAVVDSVESFTEDAAGERSRSASTHSWTRRVDDARDLLRRL
ncbi:hypothetical protein ASD16_11700 [Cellulomonas sp. Root485]|uniref:glycosyltransferase n=1 Tax=Cellulomonas sp. Root485 TaxID=1736546 RepID=UPI0006F70670|nr:glycosyltransferase [Cellulomonas sp. Root485]KQY23217.1 hypothetical protein ASD16_11700 [Cellulomonas sp. Root485]